MDIADMTRGYQALREGTAWLDLSGRGKIRATGEDRARLLHAMSTNHVQRLQPGTGCYAFFLNAQGHILADVNIFCLPDHFLLDTEPETRRKVFEHVDKYIIADDVTLEDVTGKIATLSVEGPKAPETVSSLGAPTPHEAYVMVEWGGLQVARLSATGATGFRFFLPTEEKADLIAKLESAGAAAAEAGDIRTVRLEYGRPRYGEDISESNLPHETQLMHALDFNKGCYLGQEIVERIRSRGHVNRLLVQLHLAGAGEPPAPGTKLTAESKEAGEITSAAISPAHGGAVALAYVRAEYVQRKAPFSAGGTVATLLATAPI
jgi:folate-binding protein YgfZ